jgi:CheY-like chemotaxis protein
VQGPIATGGPVLLVDDSEDDLFFFRQAATAVKAPFALQIARDGLDAVSYLAGQGAYADRSRTPAASLVLLDLKLPRKSGLEVLEWVRQQPLLQEVCCMVLTSSAEVRDLRRAYDLGAKLFMVKPMGLTALRQLVGAVAEYWQDPAAGPPASLKALSLPYPGPRPPA